MLSACERRHLVDRNQVLSHLNRGVRQLEVLKHALDLRERLMERVRDLAGSLDDGDVDRDGGNDLGTSEARRFGSCRRLFNLAQGSETRLELRCERGRIATRGDLDV